MSLKIVPGAGFEHRDLFLIMDFEVTLTLLPFLLLIFFDEKTSRGCFSITVYETVDLTICLIYLFWDKYWIRTNMRSNSILTTSNIFIHFIKERFFYFFV